MSIIGLLEPSFHEGNCFISAISKDRLFAVQKHYADENAHLNTEAKLIQEKYMGFNGLETRRRSIKTDLCDLNVSTVVSAEGNNADTADGFGVDRFAQPAA